MENLTIDLKTVMGSNIKRTSFIILISENNLKFEIVVQVMFNKMLVKVFLYTFILSYMGRNPKNPVFQFVLEMGQVLVLELLSPVILSIRFIPVWTQGTHISIKVRRLRAFYVTTSKKKTFLHKFKHYMDRLKCRL